jgi:hypothetical protein
LDRRHCGWPQPLSDDCRIRIGGLKSSRSNSASVGATMQPQQSTTRTPRLRNSASSHRRFPRHAITSDAPSLRCSRIPRRGAARRSAVRISRYEISRRSRRRPFTTSTAVSNERIRAAMCLT